MPNDADTIVIGFRGHAQLTVDWADTRSQRQTKQEADTPLSLTPDMALRAVQEAVRSLNNNSDRMCRDIESEIRNVLPPGVSVHARMSITSGSLEIAGVVTLLAGWGVAALGSDAFKQLAEKAVVFAVERVVQLAMQNNAEHQTPSGRMNVSMSGGLAVRREYTFSEADAALEATPVAVPQSRPAVMQRMLQVAPITATVLNTLLLLALLFYVVRADAVPPSPQQPGASSTPVTTTAGQP